MGCSPQVPLASLLTTPEGLLPVVCYCLLALNMNVGMARFSPEAEFVLMNFSKRVLVSKENLLEYYDIWELFTFGYRTKPGNLNSMNHNKTNYKMHNYSRL